VFTRISIAFVAVCTIVLSCLAGVANAATPPHPDCDVVYFDVNLGQGIEAFCDGAPGTYQVIAQCSDGLNVWSVPGTFAVADDGPSLAICRGLLLFPAYVLSYFVVR
jgi:hypothetical protein